MCEAIFESFIGEFGYVYQNDNLQVQQISFHVHVQGYY